MDLKALADLSSALLTPVIAVTTTVIVINQYRMERKRWRLELFEKRYAVYRAAIEYLSSMFRHGKPTEEAQARFLEGTRDRALFFDDGVQGVLDELWKASIDLEMHQSYMREASIDPEERKTHVVAAGEIKKSLPDISARATKSFGSYLNFREK